MRADLERLSAGVAAMSRLRPARPNCCAICRRPFFVACTVHGKMHTVRVSRYVGHDLRSVVDPPPIDAARSTGDACAACLLGLGFELEQRRKRERAEGRVIRRPAPAGPEVLMPRRTPSVRSRREARVGVRPPVDPPVAVVPRGGDGDRRHAVDAALTLEVEHAARINEAADEAVRRSEAVAKSLRDGREPPARA